MEKSRTGYARLRNRLSGFPSVYQIQTYNNIIGQLKAAGVKPYEVIEESYYAYKCIIEKNIQLAFKNGVKLSHKGEGIKTTEHDKRRNINE